MCLGHREWNTSTGSIWISFYVDCVTDIDIGLLSDQYDFPASGIFYAQTNMYEILVSGWASTQSSIRYGPENPWPGLRLLQESVCVPGQYVPLWVSFDYPSGVLSYGRGNIVGLSESMSYKFTGDKRFKVKYFSFSDWSQPEKWANILWGDFTEGHPSY